MILVVLVCDCFRATKVGWAFVLTSTVLHYVLLTHILLHMWRNMSVETRTIMISAHGWVSHVSCLLRASRIMSKCSRVFSRPFCSHRILEFTSKEFSATYHSGGQTPNKTSKLAGGGIIITSDVIYPWLSTSELFSLWIIHIFIPPFKLCYLLNYWRFISMNIVM
jgi:hypothetical protein